MLRALVAPARMHNSVCAPFLRADRAVLMRQQCRGSLVAYEPTMLIPVVVRRWALGRCLPRRSGVCGPQQGP